MEMQFCSDDAARIIAFDLNNNWEAKLIIQCKFIFFIKHYSFFKQSFICLRLTELRWNLLIQYSF